MRLALTLAAVLALAGCSNLTERQQRITSGAAVGGALACLPGAVIGAAVGALSEVAQ